MKPTLITLPNIYADWSAIGWAMVLGHAPESSDMKPNGTPAARKAVKRKPAPRKAPGKKRAPMKKKRTKR